MISFFEWFKTSTEYEKPWLVLGKGPSFSRRHEFEKEMQEYHTVGINHVARELPVYVTHIIDAIRADEIPDFEKQSSFLLMPWHPHIKWSATKKTLKDFVNESAVIRRFDDSGRLLWYNLGTGPGPREGAPVVEVKYFSSEAVVGLLALAGVKKIRTLGVDGGKEYAEDFSDMHPTGSNPTYALQLPEIKRTAEKFKIDLRPIAK